MYEGQQIGDLRALQINGQESIGGSAQPQRLCALWFALRSSDELCRKNSLALKDTANLLKCCGHPATR